MSSRDSTVLLRPRRRLPSHERRAEIVAAVVELARERGPEAITTQAIADRVALTHGALFRHFADKEAIWVAVFDWVRGDLGAAVDAAFAGGGSPVEILERVFLAHARFVARHPGAPRILYHALQGDERAPMHERAHRMVAGYARRVAACIREARDAGDLSPALDPQIGATLFVATLQGLALQRSLLGGEGGIVDAARATFSLLLDGMRGVPQ
ncbi:MAG: TetR/AcrR family transcriptional regulator [Burkholderiaceae bacterium]|nr:TetR/AcrR family transcriptional regulator [Burkholderiaceae bacterium]